MMRMHRAIFAVIALTFFLPFDSGARTIPSVGTIGSVLGASTQCPNLTRNLSLGSRGNDVAQLQQFLIEQNHLATRNATGYFGRLTQSAVQQFQCKHMSICSGSPASNGYGSVGPKTRAKIAGVCTSGKSQTNDSKDVALIQGQVVVTFSGSVTKDRAISFLRGLNLSTYQGTPEDVLTAKIQFREFAYPSTKLQALFAYLREKSLVDECRITGEYPSERTVNAECTFGRTVSKDVAAQAVHTYPGVGLYTQQPNPQVVYWPDTFFLAHVVVSVPAGKERQWEIQLRSYPEIASVSVVPLTQNLPPPLPVASPPTTSRAMCTTDVKQCPDGSYVSRVAPSCQFAACSAPVSKGQTTSQTSLNIPMSSISYPATSLLDFLVQDVCVDGNNVPTAGDPATCSQHRDMKFGEFIPYQKTDKSWGNLYQSAFSYPTQAPNGSLLVMKAMEFGGATPGSAFRDFDIFSPAIDGFDLLEANGAYISNIASQDPEGLKPFWNPQCGHEDTWIAFPSDLQRGVNGNTSAFKLAAGLTCPSQFSPALNIWHYYDTPLTYTSGKSLESIVSWHYDTDDTTQIKAYEQFYFTREYGETRWERWETPEFCRSYAPTVGINPDIYCVPETASGSCNGAADLPDVFGHRMIRVACRDWTYTDNVDVPINPLTNPLGGSMVHARNLLKAGDFAQGRSDGWQKFGTPPVSFDLKKDSTNNWQLEAACALGCTGENNSLYQDVAASTISGKQRILFGGILRASKETTATISIHILNSRGERIGGKNTIMHVGTSAQHRDDSLDWDFSSNPAVTIRYQIYLNDPSARYTIDESYVTPVTSAQ